jgi:hypothetical protein
MLLCAHCTEEEGNTGAEQAGDVANDHVEFMEKINWIGPQSSIGTAGAVAATAAAASTASHAVTAAVTTDNAAGNEHAGFTAFDYSQATTVALPTGDSTAGAGAGQAGSHVPSALHMRQCSRSCMTKRKSAMGGGAGLTGFMFVNVTLRIVLFAWTSYLYE